MSSIVSLTLLDTNALPEFARLAREAAYDLAVLLSPGHKRYLDPLHPNGHSEAELAEHFANAGLDFEESGLVGLDGLRLLHDEIDRLHPDEVLLLVVG
ncbi:hypothetical protein ABZ814_28365 [Micromonospora musae]|uniref:hypothetical protein n=1 Tax=Micromonospora musae TaxID=1894970 RepID=UPI0033F5FBE0